MPDPLRSTSEPAPPVTVDEIGAAADALHEVVRPTPSYRNDRLSRRFHADIWLKPEYLQRTGSFKIRGAYNHLRALPAGTAVVAASAGNHAQGVARAAAALGLAATVFMPDGASIPKIEATEADGAEVVLGGATVDDALETAIAHAESTGAHLVPPFDDPDVVAGQGTIGLELAAELPAGCTILVPVGGGGLLGGVALALAGRGHRVVGIEAEKAASMRASLDAGRVVTLDSIETVADGIALRSPSALTFELCRRFADDVVTVPEEAIAEAVLLCLEQAKAVVEPAGAVGIAAVCAGLVDLDRPVVAVLSGGNVDPVLLGRLLERGLGASGRYLRVRLVVPDRPGGLAAATEAVAAQRLNVLEVLHVRRGVDLGIGRVGVDFTVETRGREHRDEAMAALDAAGFEPRPLA